MNACLLVLQGHFVFSLSLEQLFLHGGGIFFAAPPNQWWPIAAGCQLHAAVPASKLDIWGAGLSRHSWTSDG